MKRTLFWSFFSTIIPLLPLSLQAQKDQFVYAVTDSSNNGAKWTHMRKLDLKTGHFSPVNLYKAGEETDVFDTKTKKLIKPAAGTAKNTLLNAPFHFGVAAMAFDKKHNRLFFTPMLIDQLRYIDLKTSKVFYVTHQPFSNFGDLQKDEGKIITRMVIAPDGFGYALSSNGQKFIRFTTGRKSKITQLGPLIDHPSNNNISIHDRFKSYGGDMVADENGNFLLITAGNRVFFIETESRIAKYLGTLEKLPGNFTVNGMAVDANGVLLVSSATSNSNWYEVNPYTLETKPYTTASSIFKSSDLANSNFLPVKKKNNQEIVLPEVSVKSFYRNHIALFPNPVTNNRFTIQFNKIANGNYIILLTDLMGRPVQQQKMNINYKQQREFISLSSTNAKGMYLVKILNQQNKLVYTQKVLLQ